MEKYSEAVKDAQEKLELAEKKATDVSVDPGGEGEGSWTWNEGRGDRHIPAPGQKCFPQEPRPGLAQTIIIPGSG